MNICDLSTPALLVDADALEANLADMAALLPGPRLRPHVKAHKTTALARQQAAVGHTGFTCATVREVEGMAAAGLGEDLLLANEVLDARRLGALDARASRWRSTRRRRSPPPCGAGCGRCSSTSTSACRGAGSPRSGPGGSPTRPARPGSPCAA